MHESVNDRLRQQLDMHAAQAQHLKMILGILVHRLGDKATVTNADFDEMKRADAQFVMNAKPGTVLDDGTRTPDEIALQLLTGDALKAWLDAQPKAVAPPPQSNLIVAPG